MRLLINTALLRFGGAVQVALSFIHECRRHDQHEYHVVLGPGVGAVLDPADFPGNFHFHRKSFGVIKLHKLPRMQREMSAIEARVRPDCVVTTSGPPFWRSRAPHLVGFNRPLFIYPESPYLKELPSVRKAKLVTQRWLHCRYFRRDADALIVQTDDVNQRVRRLLGTDQVHTVTNSHNGWYDEPGNDVPRLPEHKMGTFRLLTLTSYYPHKNLELIPQVIHALPEDLLDRVEFVLTLTKAEYRRRIGSNIPRQIRLTGPVPPPECPSLYRECDAMFLPTLAECFSASYPEAMKMEKPIVTTDLGFARSICGEAALYFEAKQPKAAARMIRRLMNEGALRHKLIELGRMQLKRFDSAASRANAILSLCEHLVEERGSV